MILLVLSSTWITDREARQRVDVDADGFSAMEIGGDDCDDRDAGVHPGAVEACDGLDQDCTGVADDTELCLPEDPGGTGTVSGSASAGPELVLTSTETYGVEGGGLGAVVADWADRLVGGAPDALDGSGAVVVVDAGVRTTLTGDEGAALGAALIWGAGGLVVGAPGASTVYLIMEPEDGAAADVAAQLWSTTDFGGAGYGVAVANGLTTDLTLLVAAQDDSDDREGDGWNRNIVYFVDATTGSDLSAATAGVYDDNSAPLGPILQAGDVDGDGIHDAIIGAPDDGAVAVFEGPIAAWTSAEDADGGLTVGGSSDEGSHGERLGASLDLGDLDGDGQADLVAGSPGEGTMGEDAGAVILATALDDDAVDASELVHLYGEGAADGAGTSVAIGDFNGDEAPDVLVGAPGNGGGSVYVVAGPFEASLGLGSADTRADSTEPDASLGSAASWTSNALVVGAPDWPGGGAILSGWVR